MADIEYLQAANILKLQSAARLAGLRWKSGAPGYDKAGIIEKLSFNPSIMRATIAALKRGESEDNRPQFNPQGDNPFADDIRDETRAQPELQPAAVQHPLTDALVSGLLRRLEALEGYAVSKATVQTISAQDNAPLAARLDNADARLIKLEAAKPIQFIIDKVELPVVSGQHFQFPRMVRWLNLRTKDSEGNIKGRTHVLLIGPAGTGKTTAAVEFAKMMGLDVYAQPLTVDSFGVTGFIDSKGSVIETEFSRAWKNGGVLLWDEFSMSMPDAVGALNSALANDFIALPGVGNVKAHKDFYFIAGDNSDTGASAQFSARSLLDGATLDRFVRIDWSVDLKLEESFSGGLTPWLACVRAIRAFISTRDIEHVGATSRAVIMGSMGLAAGFPRHWILEDTCRKGVLIESWAQVLLLPEVKNFLQGV